jgi:hypothetical protein
LLVFPIVGLLAYSILIGVFFTGLLWWVDFNVDGLWNAPVWAKMTATYLLYLVGYFFIFSANTAMIGVTLLMLEGKQATFADGWRIAHENRRNIFIYALLAATVGIILRVFARWLGRLGGFAFSIVRRVAFFSFLNLAWQVVPILVIPILITERINPVAAMRQSSHMVTQKWGEGVVQYANLWRIFLIPLVATMLFGITACIWVSSAAQEVWMTTTLYFFVMLIVMLFIIASALSGIYTAIVYRYASTQPIAPPFEEEMVSKAFQARPSRILHFLRRRWQELIGRPHSHKPNTHQKESNEG